MIQRGLPVERLMPKLTFKPTVMEAHARREMALRERIARMVPRYD
jgi:hypothetical protein